MKSAKESTPVLKFLNQRTWRKVGAMAIGLAVLMAWYGSSNLSAADSPWYLAAYWGIFLVVLIVVMYVVLLDIRYIRLQYLLQQREIFHDTLGSEEFRRILRKAQENERQKTSK